MNEKVKWGKRKENVKQRKRGMKTKCEKKRNEKVKSNKT